MDRQSGVEAFIKIVEFKHTFAVVPYIRTNGLMAHYSPDFMVKTADKMYIVETKADKDVTDGNVRQKQKATLGMVAQINNLKSENRDDLEWEYLLLSDAKFYTMSKNGADFTDIAKITKITSSIVGGTLF